MSVLSDRSGYDKSIMIPIIMMKESTHTTNRDSWPSQILSDLFDKHNFLVYASGAQCTQKCVKTFFIRFRCIRELGGDYFQLSL